MMAFRRGFLHAAHANRHGFIAYAVSGVLSCVARSFKQCLFWNIRVLEALATYPDRDALLIDYPDLESEDIRQALAWAACNLGDEIVGRDVA